MLSLLSVTSISKWYKLDHCQFNDVGHDDDDDNNNTNNINNNNNMKLKR